MTYVRMRFSSPFNPSHEPRQRPILSRRERLQLLRIVRCPPARAQRRGLANNGSGGRRTILKGGNRGAELSRVRNDAGLWGFEGGACRAQ